MEITFKTQLLQDLYENKKVKDKEFKSNPALVKQYIKTIGRLKTVEKIEHLFQFHGLRYEKLKGNRIGHSSVRVNEQYRIIFLEIGNTEEPQNIEILDIQELSKHYE
ncbi:MAG: type II toxin-antitoxin system RelE/ParE family toxin [Bacteroidetes bacterium]|nr:type II toxin-antitoxin system RelE/ParE family toxin [Bacteroidota bacterium]